ncbi:MAG: sensor histidine kinase [Cellulosilyticaceae bacterium]
MMKKLLFYISIGIMSCLMVIHISEWGKKTFELRAYEEDSLAYYYQSTAFEATLQQHIEQTFQVCINKQHQNDGFKKIVNSPNYDFYIVMGQNQYVSGYANISNYDGKPLIGYDTFWLKYFFESKVNPYSYRVGFDRVRDGEIQVTRGHIDKVLQDMMRKYPQVEAFQVSIGNELREGDAFYTVYQELQQTMDEQRRLVSRLWKWILVEISMTGLIVIGIAKKRWNLHPLKSLMEWIAKKKYYEIFFVGGFSGYIIGSGLISWAFVEGIKHGSKGTSYFYGVSMILWQVIALYVVMLYGNNMSYIRRTLSDMVSGIVTVRRKIPREKLILNQMVQEVNVLSEKMRERAEAIGKNEKLKTELLMCVPKSLCTPVLEVVKTLEKLKEIDVKDEIAKEYIAILEERTQRFQVLLKDVIEIPKELDDGIEVSSDTVELCEVVETVVERYTDKFEMNRLEMCMVECTPTFVDGDMKFIWRILENLIGNIIKYAMPHTRVYTHIKKENGYGILTIKNMCREPIDRKAEELKERFVRGDRSRTTEGFGLGLAIVDNLVTLQKGKMEIVIDGDLFKVIIALPLSK